MTELEKLAEEMIADGLLWYPLQLNNGIVLVLNPTDVYRFILTRESALKQKHDELLKDARNFALHVTGKSTKEAAEFLAKYPLEIKEGKSDKK